MSTKKNNWKFLVIADETPEFKKVLRLGALRAKRVGGILVMLHIIPPSEFQHWMAVQEIMEEEAMQAAQEILEKFVEEVKVLSGVECEMVIRKGHPSEVIVQYIAEDKDIHLLVLGVNVDGDPGPIIRTIREELLSVLHMPVMVVPSNMTDEEIDKFI